MNKSLIGIAAIIAIGGITVFVLSPYFTESTIDESLPTGAIVQSNMMDEENTMSYAGTFIGVGDRIHDVQGDVYTIPLEDDSNVLRLEFQINKWS